VIFSVSTAAACSQTFVCQHLINSPAVTERRGRRKTSHLQRRIVLHVRLEDVDVGPPLEVGVLRNLLVGRCLVADEPDDGVCGVAGVLAEELVLLMGGIGC